MTRMWAIVERELRKFVRSPALMLVSMVLPLVQLIILGNAFGGKIRGARVAVVDNDRGPQSVKVHEAFDAIAVNIANTTTATSPRLGFLSIVPSPVPTDPNPPSTAKFLACLALR